MCGNKIKFPEMTLGISKEIINKMQRTLELCVLLCQNFISSEFIKERIAT